mmetsp:Transcript_17722/g.21840  ORF Transcript_17722/g.21840 Transcript_17722/m.21840 type:complete len:228 (-) Transcript_17722:1129-1812(-)
MLLTIGIETSRTCTWAIPTDDSINWSDKGNFEITEEEILYPADYIVATKHVQSEPGTYINCIVMTRDPVDRFISLYQYTYLGKEYQLQESYRKVHEIGSIKGSVKWIFDTWGRNIFVDGQKDLVREIENGCAQFKLEEFRNDFNATVAKLLKFLKVPEQNLKTVSRKLQQFDLNNANLLNRNQNVHATFNKLSKQVKHEIRNAVIEDYEISNFLKAQGKQLGYSYSN